MSLIELPLAPKDKTQDVRAVLETLADNELADMLMQVVGLVEEGKSLVVRRSPDAEVSPKEASEMVNMSRTFICRLLDQGVIPEQPRVGTHRRILVSDLEEFMKNRGRASRHFAKSLAHAEDSKAQLVRDIAGVSREEASKFGY
ncbi:helix-turn-helix domain-containing protein [Glutamicibacter sp. 287]|uniref:helix-turn-helix domain-containing protein n=1 Tax=unclassified Glutamicibacter TaxID=2627139 RepID=UPI000BB97D68|nr:helix-turn-helix domain-containing protein [Glutamicibacter sp. BW80]PCC28689.1 hypothetical protein CIK76_10755 [Glutamicibacter sp. BW80]